MSMKHNAKSLILIISEYLVLIAPTTGYAIYCYQDTLQYTMTATSKGSFWSLVAVAILASVLFGIFRKKYDRYVQGYVQQKTDLETNPTNELLIKRVAHKKKIIDNLDYVVALFPVLILMSVIGAFQQAIEQLLILLSVLAGSLVGKISLHLLTIFVEEHDMLKKIEKDGDE
ncbi:MAG TPA: hypothetical protein DE061_01490 [Clostridiales bacterium]|nr:hypothetical protein [Clostridiales bacterium]